MLATLRKNRVGLYFVPLVTIWSVEWFVPAAARGHLAATVTLATVLLVIGAVFLTVLRAAQAFEASDGNAEVAIDSRRFIGERLRREVFRAAELAGRWTVACLLWVVVFWGGQQLLAVLIGGIAPVELATLKSDYLDVALLAGPLIAMVLWGSEQFIKLGREMVSSVRLPTAEDREFWAQGHREAILAGGFPILCAVLIVWLAWAVTS